MALIHLQVVTRNGDSKYAGGIVLNTKFMAHLRCYDSGALFEYYSRPEIRPGAEDMYIVDETKTYIRGVADAGNASEMIDLAVYPDRDPTQTPVHKEFNIDEIVKVLPYPADRDLSLLWLNEKGRKVRKLLVDQYYVDIPGIARTGSSSTTTSTTSTSSTSTTSTSSTSTTSTTTSEQE